MVVFARAQWCWWAHNSLIPLTVTDTSTRTKTATVDSVAKQKINKMGLGNFRHKSQKSILLSAPPATCSKKSGKLSSEPPLLLLMVVLRPPPPPQPLAPPLPPPTGRLTPHHCHQQLVMVVHHHLCLETTSWPPLPFPRDCTVMTSSWSTWPKFLQVALS